MPRMRLLSVALASSVLVTGCASTSYKIPGRELERIAALTPELRGQRVRVQQELGEAEVGQPQPVTAETQIVYFPHVSVHGPYERRRHYQTNSSWGGPHGGGGGGGNPRSSGGLKLGGGGGGGDGKGAAIVILVAA